MEWPLLAVLSDEDRTQLLARARRRRFTKGEVIFHEGDAGESLYLVANGRVGVRLTTPLGDTTTLRIIAAGGWFGELALLLPGPRNATIVALEPVEALVLHRDAVAEVRDRVPAFERIVAEALVGEVRRLSAALLEALFVPAETRILRRLAELSTIYGQGEARAVIPLTQDEIARLAGTTRPTVNKVLQAATARGMLNLGRGHIEICDIDALVRRGH